MKIPFIREALTPEELGSKLAEFTILAAAPDRVTDHIIAALDAEPTEKFFLTAFEEWYIFSVYVAHRAISAKYRGQVELRNRILDQMFQSFWANLEGRDAGKFDIAAFDLRMRERAVEYDAIDRDPSIAQGFVRGVVEHTLQRPFKMTKQDIAFYITAVAHAKATGEIIAEWCDRYRIRE